MTSRYEKAAKGVRSEVPYARIKTSFDNKPRGLDGYKYAKSAYMQPAGGGYDNPLLRRRRDLSLNPGFDMPSMHTMPLISNTSKTDRIYNMQFNRESAIDRFTSKNKISDYLKLSRY